MLSASNSSGGSRITPACGTAKRSSDWPRSRSSRPTASRSASPRSGCPASGARASRSCSRSRTSKPRCIAPNGPAPLAGALQVRPWGLRDFRVIDPELLGRLADELDAGLAELRELAHGIHPAVLTDHGLRSAVDGAARSAVPVSVCGDLERRPAAAVESALYFTVAEALTNVVKYAEAGAVTVTIAGDEGQAEVGIRDDGRGGADPSDGSGLRGLVDRLGALGGHLHIESPQGLGTAVRAVVPLDPHDPHAHVSCGCCAEGQCRCAP